MIFILDKNEEMVGVLDNNAPFACPYYGDLHTEQLNDGLLTYTLYAPAEHATAEHLITQAYLVVPDLDGKLELFRITESTEELDSNGNYVRRVFAENAAVNELMGEIIRPVTLKAYAPDDVLDYILQGTIWKRGYYDWDEVATYDFTDYPTALKALLTLVNTSDMEIKFRVTFSGNRIIGRYIDIKDRRGEDARKRFEYARDIQGVKRHEDSSELATAIIAIGKEDANGKRLTIKDIAYGDKPAGQDFIEDDAALDRWGKDGRHIFAVYENNDAASAVELAGLAKKELDRRKNPRLTYEVDVLLLESANGYDHESVRIGDTVIVKDLTFNPYLLLEARVIELQRSYTDPTRDKATLGEFKPLFISTNSILKKLDSMVSAKMYNWDAPAEKPVHRDKIPPIDTDLLWLDLNKVPYVWKAYDGVSKTWQPATSTNFGELGGQVVKDQIGNAAVGSSQIEASAVTNTKIAENAVGTTQIAPKAVTTTEIKDGAVTTTTIATGAVTSTVIADNAVTSNKIPAGTITDTKLADLAVTAQKIKDGAIVFGKVAANAIDGNAIAANAVTAAKIIDGAINSAKIANNAVGNAQLAALAVQAANLAAGAVTTTKIADDAITENKIVDNAITRDKIAPNSIGTNEIEAGAIRAAQMNWASHLIF